MLPPLWSWWSPSAVLLVLVIFSLQLQERLTGATVAVGNSSPWADEKSENSVTCTPSETIRFLRWYKSSITEEFTDAEEILRLFVITGAVTFDSSVNSSHYSFDKSVSDYPLTIKRVGLDDASVSYWCDVELEDGRPNERDKTSFQVRRIPASIALTQDGTSYNDGSEAKIIEGENQFECSVPNIKPAAMFAWTLGPTVLNSFTMWNKTNEDPRLVNSYSTLTVTVTADSELTCSAQNKQDGTTTPDQSISINLKTRKDPCSERPCLNEGTCSPTAEGFQCSCAEGFTGDICADAVVTEEPTTTPKPPTQTSADMNTTTTPQDTSTPTSPTQETTMSPTGPPETTPDLNSTGSNNESTTPTGSSEMTIGSTYKTNSTYPPFPSTTANTPETTTECTALCDEETPRGLSVGVIIGIVVGSLCLCVITVGGGIAFWKYNTKTEVSPESNQSKKGKNKEADGKVEKVDV